VVIVRPGPAGAAGAAAACCAAAGVQDECEEHNEEDMIGVVIVSLRLPVEHDGDLALRILFHGITRSKRCASRGASARVPGF
jgi:hypothetical protein